MSNYVVIDVESPNRHANSICSIALAVIENNQITEQFYSLVNPETTFDDMCIHIHGITPTLVKDAPTFPELWPQIEHYFTNHVLIAHNATYDLSVISKVLAMYNILSPDLYYLCTMRLAQKFHNCQSFSLNSLCKDLSIPLTEHHNSAADALACATLFLTLTTKYAIDIDQEITQYGHAKKSAKTSSSKSIFSQATISLQEFKGIAQGIILDDVVTDKEIIGINDWINDNPQLKGHYPFDKISQTCTDILSDGVITPLEKNTMLTLLHDFVYPTSTTENNQEKICFENKLFCLTGDFVSGTKNEVSAKIIARGGICKSNIVNKTDYLIVGGSGNENWKFGNYGGKVNRAKELQDKGLPIKILSEDELLNSL